MEAPPHEETIEHKVVHFLDSKFGWPIAIVLMSFTVLGTYQMKPSKLRKMMLQNATFCCLILSLLTFLIKIRRIHRA